MQLFLERLLYFWAGITVLGLLIVALGQLRLLYMLPLSHYL